MAYGVIRLDKDNEETTVKLTELGVDLSEFESSPIDVCLACYDEHAFTDDVAAPPLEDAIGRDKRYCVICGEELLPVPEVPSSGLLRAIRGGINEVCAWPR